MPKTPFFSLLVAALLGGVLGGLVAAFLGPDAAAPAAERPRSITPEDAPGVPAAPVADEPAAPLLPADWEPRLEELEGRVAALAAELELARGRAEVRPDGSELAEEAPRLEALLREVEAGGGDLGGYVHDLIERDVEERERERELAELERRRAVSAERARRIAESVGLDDYDRDQLAEVLLTEMTRLSELRDAARAEGGTGLRDAFREVRAWKDEELEARFGPDLAAAVEEAEGGRRGGRFGGGGFGGGGDRAGRRGGSGGDS